MRVRHLFTLGWFAGWLSVVDFHDPAEIADMVMWASFSLICLIFIGKFYAAMRSGRFEDNNEEDDKPIKATREDFR